jgi:hypothetical protein
MYRRIRNREKMVLAVRVSGQTADGEKFNALTHTVDIAISGGRLGGMFHLRLREGDVIEVRRNGRKGTFRVVWIGEPDSNRYGHVGIQAVRVPPNFWGLELPEKGEATRPFSLQRKYDRASVAG